VRTAALAFVALAGILAVVATVTVGGWYAIGDGDPPPDLPTLAGLDAWIGEREATEGARGGLEARVVWHDRAERTRTPVALVYLPGMGASPLETMPLSDSVAADLGANLYYHRPAGHVLRSNTMQGVRVGDWLTDAREALAIGGLLGDRVVLVGMSNGGALAAWAAIRHPEALDALVLLSPNFGPVDPAAGLLALPGGRLVARLALGPVHTWQPENAAQAAAWDTAYPSAALVPMMRLSTWVDQARRLRTVEAPTLIVYSAEDQVVDPDEIRRAGAWIGSTPTRLVPIEGVEAASRHVLAGDAVSPGTTEPVRRIITEFLRDALPAESVSAALPGVAGAGGG
jgi:pimeloyl-ACP methyl ester carboxylesterase